MKISDTPLSAGLYLIATPIGNARDITLRALDLLAGADVLAAEDTRSLRKLMQIHGVALNRRPMIACHDHSGEAVVARLMAEIAAGRAVVYASEAGTPLISDPGFLLVRAARAAGLPVTAAPGASAVLAALTVAGLPAEKFLFLGFLPAAPGARAEAIREVVREQFSIVLYESPHRIEETMVDLAAGLGGTRRAALCRELTKKFEEVRSGTLAELAADPGLATLKGEMVIVLGPPEAEVTQTADVKQALEKAMAVMRIKDAANAVAGALGLPRREVYQIALAMQGES